MKRLLTALAIASTVALGAANSAFAAGPAPIRISHGDPFAGCRLGGNGTAVNYRSAEVEPWVADNPANTANLIGTWQQDRWSDGGAKGQVASWSFDGGKTWGQTPQPFTRCAQPFYDTPVLQYDRTSDPWVSFGPDGTAYAVSLPFDGDFIRNGLGAAVSRDGGRTWIRQQDIDPLVAGGPFLNPSDDKQSVTADPVHVGFAYAVWEQFQDVFTCPAAARAATMIRSGRDGTQRTVRAAATAAPGPCGLTAPTMFSFTGDGGRTWSKPKPIVPTGVNEQTIDNQIVIDRHKGILYNFYDYIDASGQNWIEMVTSNDQGATWSPRQRLQRLFTNEETNACFCGVTYPHDQSKPIRQGDIIPSFAIDPNSGQLYMTWQDRRANPDPTDTNDMLFASTSTLGGAPGTWSLPVRVNPPTDQAAFTAAISVDTRGRVGVTYYDFTPPLTSPDILLTDTWFTQTSGPGLDFGPRKLIGGPYNMLAAPFARGYFVGDYQGLAALLPNAEEDSQDGSGHQQGNPDNGGGGNGGRGGEDQATGFVPIFVMSNCRNNSCRAQGSLDGRPVGPDSTDVFTARLGGDSG